MLVENMDGVLRGLDVMEKKHTSITLESI